MKIIILLLALTLTCGCTEVEKNLDELCKAYKCETCIDPTPTPNPTPIPYKENGDYHGRYNGDRPTWYFDHNMSWYPSSFSIIVEGCGTVSVINNNGTRFESGSYIVKQSDVAGRGMALVFPASCKSTKSSLEY